jgi:DNA-binding NtrC family response regulator
MNDIPKPTVLVVDDERGTREGLERALRERYEVRVAEDGEKALTFLEAEPVAVLITDLKMPGMDGLTLLKRAVALQRPPLCIVMTAYGSIENAVEAMQAGAHHYLTKPNINLDELELVIQRGLGTRQIEVENTSLRQQLDQKFGLENIVGESPVMNAMFDVIRQVAPTRATTLITGETGTGKELVAHAIHNLSPRRKNAFIAVHAAALPSGLLESELFGHEKGAFTGAVERRVGRFELADGGTIFLDEVGELEPQMQVKLLRVLEERAFERVGGQKTLQVDVRLVAATNKNLRKMVTEGKFRDDLFYRLSVVTIALPPLRERREDIPVLVSAFLRQCSEENGKRVTELTSESMAALMAYDWPGNVRELRNTVEQMVVLAHNERLTMRDIPAGVRCGTDLTKGLVVRSGMTVDEAEKQLIMQALKETGSNRTKAAKRIGISRRTMHRKLKQYDLRDL